MSDEHNPLDYKDTLERMEPGIAPVDLEITTASIAISLKKIAASLADIQITMHTIAQSGQMVSSYIPYLQNLNALSGIGGHLSNLNHLSRIKP